MWYDIFSLFYDRSLEALYREARQAAVAHLRSSGGDCVIDVACGTGQNFDLVLDQIGETGCLVGVDQSRGMLKQARKRVDKAGWANVRLVQADVHAFDSDALQQACGVRQADAVVCALGLTAFPDWEAAFQRTFDLLRPGGRYVILDVFAEERIMQTTSVEWVARADLSRQVWRPLEAACTAFERSLLPGSPKTFGGQLFVASGTRQAS